MKIITHITYTKKEEKTPKLLCEKFFFPYYGSANIEMLYFLFCDCSSPKTIAVNRYITTLGSMKYWLDDGNIQDEITR